MQSFLDNGYKSHLFTKCPLNNMPDYVEYHDADEIYEQPDIQGADMQ